jgi:site-specific DNA recombinase
MTVPPLLRAATYARQSSGSEKSIDDQDRENRAAADEQGWQIAAAYRDGTSAWRGRAARDEWERVLADIEAQDLDVLILWEPSRGDRVAETWLGLLRRCRTAKTRIYITSEDTLYDMAKTRDWRHLAEQGLDSEVESDKTSKRVQRGQQSAAAAGHPSQGRTPFGYTRTHEVVPGENGAKQRVIVRQDIDPATAPIVREIFERLARNEAVGAICTDLNSRGVPTLTAQRWYRARITDMARNPAYIAVRRYNGAETPGDWPALIEPATFHAVQRILTGPGHRRTSPGQQRHLLSYLAACAACGANLCAVLGRYKCLDRGCVTIVQAPLDDLVRDLVLARLVEPHVYERFRQAGAESDRAVLDAQNEVATLQARLDVFRRSAAKGDTSPESLAFIEAELTADIRAAQRRADIVGIPPALRPFLEPGADVQARWKAATLPARREVLRTVADLKVGRAGSPGSREFEPTRLDNSRWLGDPLTWGERRVLDAA